MRSPTSSPVRRVLACLLLVGLAAACTDGGPGSSDIAGEGRRGPNPGPLPTLPGGLELAAVDPAAAFVGDGLAHGSPLPSEQLAAEALADAPEVAAAVTRRVLLDREARHLADVVAVTLQGSEIVDEAALAAFERALVAALAGVGPAGPAAVDGAVPEVVEEEVVGRPLLVAGTDERWAMAHREGDLLVVVLADVEADARLVATRQVEARARGEVGVLEPRTPMVALPAEAAFVDLATVAFAPIPPLEEEPTGPTPPTMAGAAGGQGRYGVIAGERRTVVWSMALDPAAHPSAESVAPLLGPLASERAGGAPADVAEVLDRIVVAADAPVGERSARAFRHQGLVLLVEGDRPDQLDAVVTAWIAALGPG